MVNPCGRLNSLIFFIAVITISIFFPVNKTFSRSILTIVADPSSGIGPLEVNLHCFLDKSSSTPLSYEMDFGDGTEPEIAESNQYSYTFTHTYQAGFYKPNCDVVRAFGRLATPAYGKVILAKWKFKTNGDVDSSPAIGLDGTVYVGSDDGNLYALNPETGEEVWRFPAGAEVRSSPAVAPDGTIYFGSADGYFYALRPNGVLKWSFNVGDYIFSSPAISSDGRIVIFGSSDNNIYALNASSGILKWKYETDNKIISSPAIGHDGISSVVYVGSLDRHVYALALNNGALKWKFETNAEVYGSPAITSDGRIVVGECKTGVSESYNFQLFSINVDGSKFWETGGATGFYSSPAIGNTIHAGSWDGYLLTFNKSGIYSWSHEVRQSMDINSSPAVDSGGVVYVGCKNGNFYALQSQDAAEEPDRRDWTFQTGDSILYSSPVIDEGGTIYFGSRDDCVYAINPGGQSIASEGPWPMFRGNSQHSATLENSITIPSVISSSPSPRSTGISAYLTEIKVNFSPEIVAAQIDTDSFRVRKNNVNPQEIEGYATLKSVRYNNSAFNVSAVFERKDEDALLDYNTEYICSIRYREAMPTEGEDTLEEGGDGGYEETFSWTFKTQAEPEEESSGSGGDPSCFINAIR